MLYRYDVVKPTAETGGVIHLCEGEKDADAVADAGGVGTTTPMGASKWQPQYTEQLRGSHVLIHADRDYLTGSGDDAGAIHAHTVAQLLTEAGITCQVVEAAEGKDVADHLQAGLTLADLVTIDQDTLTARLPQPEHPDQDDAQILTHPAAADQGEPTLHTIPTSRGRWAYSTHDDPADTTRLTRGVYTMQEGAWVKVAPLPYVQAQIVRRDGTGRRIGADYLLSLTPDGPGTIIDRDGLRTATWANDLGVSLSTDDKIQRAAHTAIIYHGETSPIREAIPRIDEHGAIAVSIADTLPTGYSQISPVNRAEGLRAWADLIGHVARSPKMALVLGASAIAPYVAAAKRQSHILYLYADPGVGKTVTLQTAGCVWGDATTADSGVVLNWNTTAMGVLRHCGELGVLTPFVDEIGAAGEHMTPKAWGAFIFKVCQGASRMTADTRGLGTRLSRPWHGIFIGAGNGRLTHGLGAGQYAGIARRVIELNTPFTLDEAHAQAIEDLWGTAYGHAGAELQDRHDFSTVRPLITAAADLFPELITPNGKAVAKHLHAHVAGAAMLDDIAGTGTTLRDAALAAAQEYLDEWAEPQHDADRMIHEIRTAIGAEPAMWPTQAEYDEIRRPAEYGHDGWDNTNTTTRLPQHGINRSMSGVRDDNNQWVAVFAPAWRQMCKDLDVDPSVALHELERRGILQTTTSRRRRNEWTVQVKTTGTGMYKLILPPVDDDTDTPTQRCDPASEPPETAPVGGRLGVGWGSGWGSGWG